MAYAGFRYLLLCLILINIVTSLVAQHDSTANKGIDKKRLVLVTASESVCYGGSMAGLNFLWYANHPRSSFHFFNDNTEWLQMDKAGHAVTSYQIGRLGINLFRWSGVAEKKAVYFGAGLGTVYLSTIELLDAFSPAWGFSTGDFIANIAGSGILLAQELLRAEEMFTLKFSFSKSPYAAFRPDLLGYHLSENVLKDYNGQTYWLSWNIGSMLHKPSSFPRWLNLAIGYGAEGMTGARSNPVFIDNIYTPVFPRYRQYYFSLDVDLTKIRTKSPFLRSLFNVFNIVKIPSPAVEFNRIDKVKWWGLQF